MMRRTKRTTAPSIWTRTIWRALCRAVTASARITAPEMNIRLFATRCRESLAALRSLTPSYLLSRIFLNPLFLSSQHHSNENKDKSDQNSPDFHLHMKITIHQLHPSHLITNAKTDSTDSDQNSGFCKSVARQIADCKEYQLGCRHIKA